MAPALWNGGGLFFFKKYFSQGEELYGGALQRTDESVLAQVQDEAGDILWTSVPKTGSEA